MRKLNGRGRRGRRPFGGGMTRRDALRAGFGGLGLMLVGPTLSGCGSSSGNDAGLTSNIANLGPLGEPDENGIRLPEGFTSRVVARSREAVIPGSDYRWHLAPDGGATFAAEDGGWVYVSNSEIPGVGGVGALRFDADANLIDAYPILRQTNVNCAGGPTPWGTWLSCEEVANGRVFECDPFGSELHPDKIGIERPALGYFQHEAATVDPEIGQLYLTEDVPDGAFYRFTPDRMLANGHPDLTSGTLEVAQVHGDPTGQVEWHVLADPNPDLAQPEGVATRYQVAASTAFRGGEGIWYHEGVVYFSTKGDNRIWAYDVADSRMDLLYDDDNFENPILRGVDNIVVTPTGDVCVAEDGGDMQIVAITPAGVLVPLLQIVGQDESEITGPAFSPDLKRLYFSSQRGIVNFPFHGITYEVTGPFFG